MQPGFQNLPLKVSTSDGRNFTLLEPFSFVTRAGEVYTVPAGSQSDGASTPQAGWNILPPFGPYWPAAFLHDWTYRYSNLPKPVCDSLLLEAMEISGVGEVERMTIYEGVHLGGWKAFREDRQMPDQEGKGA